MLDIKELYSGAAGAQTVWFSFENPTGAKGAGATANKGAKGAPCRPLGPRQRVTLVDYRGSGVIRHIWMTYMGYNKPELSRGLRIEMTWDGSAVPAVDVPVEDFFCNSAHGELKVFENALFSCPEGRSFNCFAPMPFLREAKICLYNASDVEIRQIYYCIEATAQQHGAEIFYFHTHWSRCRRTDLGVDFELLPRVAGAGRFLGVNVNLNFEEQYSGTWFGEGEVKIYLDGDGENPSLACSGTEDYIGTAWGQGEFDTAYFGCTHMKNSGDNQGTSFYRLHIPDPVWFQTDCRVTLQQIGSCDREPLLALLSRTSELQLIYAIAGDVKTLVGFMDGEGCGEDPAAFVKSHDYPFYGFYRHEDVAAAAYFYLDRP